MWEIIQRTSMTENFVRQVLAVVSCALLLSLNSCTQQVTESAGSSDPNDPPNWGHYDTFENSGALFVMLGGDGVGTAADPLGSIVAALEICNGRVGTDSIYLAGGSYNELVIISSSVILLGSRSPHFGWKEDITSPTIIMGGEIDGHEIGLVIKQVEARVALSRITISAPDAKVPGKNSIGLYCLHSSSITLTSCQIQSGSGAAGNVGETGLKGEINVNSVVGKGGSGGAGATQTSPLGNGTQGTCIDGSRTGGAGGTFSVAPGIGMPGLDATDALPLANDKIYIETSRELPFPKGNRGSNAGDGQGGCGGGGACGGTVWIERDRNTGQVHYYSGPWGGRGGDGGHGGGHGYGGMGGGHSIGIFAQTSLLQISDCSIIAGFGGQGGDGGAGGIGQVGQPGSFGGQVGGSFAGGGATGGKGGNGGSGSGAAGGWSIGVLLSSSRIDLGLRGLLVTLGAAGSGGWNNGHTQQGQAGKVLKTYTIDD